MNTLRGLCFFLLLGMPNFVAAAPLTLDFLGSYGGGGTAIGSLTYDTADAPTAFNVRGLANNAVYTLTGWNFSLTAIEAFMPATTFASGAAGSTAEFCLGNCVFSSPAVTNLIFRNDQGLLMQLTFQTFDPAPFVTPPANVSQWGTLREGVYRVPCPICVPVTLFTDGVLTTSTSQPVAVPEPSSWLLLGLAVVWLVGWQTWRRRATSSSSRP